MYKRTKSTKGNNEETKRREESLTITRPPKGRKLAGFFIEKFIFSELNISADKYEESN